MVPAAAAWEWVEGPADLPRRLDPPIDPPSGSPPTKPRARPLESVLEIDEVIEFVSFTFQLRDWERVAFRGRIRAGFSWTVWKSSQVSSVSLMLYTLPVPAKTLPLPSKLASRKGVSVSRKKTSCTFGASEGTTGVPPPPKGMLGSRDADDPRDVFFPCLRRRLFPPFIVGVADRVSREGSCNGNVSEEEAPEGAFLEPPAEPEWCGPKGFWAGLALGEGGADERPPGTLDARRLVWRRVEPAAGFSPPMMCAIFLDGKTMTLTYCVEVEAMTLYRGYRT